MDETTVLIGENNVGKTTILDALQLCLSRSLTRRQGVFAEYDYHLPDDGSQPSEGEPIEITLHFTEAFEGEWPVEVPQLIGDAIQIGDDGKQRIILRVQSRFDELVEDFVTQWHFLDVTGNELVKANLPRNIIALQQLAPVFYLSARRDSTQEFGPRSQFWRPFIRSLKIDPAVRQELEEGLDGLNRRVLETSESFAEVEERLSNTSRIVPLSVDDPVTIEAIPSRVIDILSRTRVLLASQSGARLPIGRHGEGTQSLAVICLFDAFLQKRLSDIYTEHTAPILALEEPEAHLHPSAIHSATTLVQQFSGQKIIATHAGDVVAATSLRSLRRLSKQKGEITVHQLGEEVLTEMEMQKINYHIRSTRGNLLFARCWLLVEGITDRIIFEGCAKVLDKDFVDGGVGFLEYQHIGIGVEAVIRFADSMGIGWFLVADGDQAGGAFVNSGRKQISGRNEQHHISQLRHGNMEVFLCEEGFGEIYEAAVPPQNKDSIEADVGTRQYWQQVAKALPANSKPRCAIAVVDEMEKQGIESVPDQLRKIVGQTLNLAGRGCDG